MSVVCFGSSARAARRTPRGTARRRNQLAAGSRLRNPETQTLTEAGYVADTAHVRMARKHHSVYVVYLKNPRGDGRAGYYVGMTGLTPEQRFENHRTGVKAARIVRRCGVRLVPKLYAHLNPMSYDDALAMEARLAADLRRRGFKVFGGH